MSSKRLRYQDYLRYFVRRRSIAGAGSPPPAPVATSYAVTAASYSPGSGANDDIQAQLLDQFGGPMAEAGHTVTWSKSVTDGSFSTGTSVTDASGIATVTLIAPTVNEALTVTATDEGSRTGTSAAITVTGGTITPDATMTSILNGLLDNGEIDFYTGAPPRSAADAAASTLLATLTFSAPAGTNPPDMISNNSMNLHITGPAFVITNGTVGWARVRLPNGAGQFDGLVGLTGSGQPFIVDTASLTWATGQTLSQVSLIATTGV